MWYSSYTTSGVIPEAMCLIPALVGAVVLVALTRAGRLDAEPAIAGLLGGAGRCLFRCGDRTDLLHWAELVL